MKQINRTIAVGSLLAALCLVPATTQAQLKHRYQFNETSGTLLQDSQGTADATLVNNTGNATLDGARVTLGNTGGQSSNSGAGDYIDLPNGLITGMNAGAGATQFSLETWFTRTGGNNWQRVWDLGTSVGGEDVSDSGNETAQIFHTPQSGAGGSIRAAFRPNGGAEEAPLDVPGPSPANELTHTLFVWDETTTSARLYVNGALVAERTDVAMTIANDFFNAGTPLDVNNWLGRAQWNDPMFVGSYDEFRVYESAVSPAQAVDSFADGPDTTGGLGAGALSSLSVTGSTDLIRGTTANLTATANYANTTVDVTSDVRTSYSSDNESIATVGGDGLVTAVGDGSATITVDFDGQAIGTTTVNVSFDLQSLALQLGETDLILGGTTAATVLGDFPQGTGVNITGAAGLVYGSSTPAATVDATGLVTGANEGQSDITVSFNAIVSNPVQVTVTIPPRPEAVLAHRYTFDEDTGAPTALKDTVDTSGSSDGLLLGTVSFNGDGTANFPGDRASYIDFPNGLASGLGANGTLEAWVTFPSSGAGGWQRVWDFGNTSLGEDPLHPDLGGTEGYQGEASWFYAPRQGGITAGNGGRYAYDPGPDGEAPQIDPPAALGAPTDEEFHVLATYNHDQRVAQLWINGQLAGEAPVLGDRPLSGLDDVNNWLGRSQWSGDANATATFNEFRMYAGVPSALEIAVNVSAGPDTLITDPGAVQSVAVQADASTAVEGTAPVPISVVAQFENIADVNVSFVPGVELASDNPSVARLIPNPTRILAVGPGTATITASLDGEAAVPLTFTVTAAPSAPTITYRYPLDTNADDVEGGQNGTLVDVPGGAAGVFEDGGITMSGFSYINLPNFIFGDFWYLGDPDNLPAVTLEIFGSIADAPAFQRVLDFGATDHPNIEDPTIGDAYGGTTFAFLSPTTGGGNLVFSMTADVAAASGDIQGDLGRIESDILGVDQDYHLVVVVDPANAVTRMYRNGVFAGVASLPDTADFRTALVNGTAVNDVNVWLGRSQFSGDAYFNGRITEFRMWQGAMQEAQVRQNYGCGPDNPAGCTVPAAPTLTVGQQNGNVLVSWPKDAFGFMPYVINSFGNGAPSQRSANEPLTTGETKTLSLPATEAETYIQLQAGE